MQRVVRLIGVGAAMLGLAGLSACGANGGDSDAGVRIMVPNSPGGGYDTTARVAAKILEVEDLNKDMEVYNLEGAGGTVGLARLVQSKGDPGEMMLMGLGVVGAQYTNQTDSTLAQTTPIARLISEPDIVVVAADSPIESMQDLTDKWSRDPGAFPIGGGSSPGGPDHLAAHLVAKAVGVIPSDVNYVTFDGGGPLLASLLNGEVKAGVSGLGEYKDQIEAGELRVLGVTSAERVDGFDAPTLIEQDIDLNFVNWRGLVAPPDISDDEIQRLTTLVEDMHATDAWGKAMAENGWTDALLTGDEFGAYIEEETERVETVLSELGLL